jgi:hypothetical protein
MAKPYADVYLADVFMWNGLGPDGMPGGADRPPKPKERKGADLVVPYIAVCQSWSDTIDEIIEGLQPRHPWRIGRSPRHAG